VNNDAGALLQHRWQERAIQTDGREEIKVERPLPLTIIEHRETTRRRGGTTDDVHDDVDTAELLHHGVSYCGAALGSRDIRRHE